MTLSQLFNSPDGQAYVELNQVTNALRRRNFSLQIPPAGTVINKSHHERKKTILYNQSVDIADVITAAAMHVEVHQIDDPTLAMTAELAQADGAKHYHDGNTPAPPYEGDGRAMGRHILDMLNVPTAVASSSTPQPMPTPHSQGAAQYFSFSNSYS